LRHGAGAAIGEKHVVLRFALARGVPLDLDAPDLGALLQDLRHLGERGSRRGRELGRVELEFDLARLRDVDLARLVVVGDLARRLVGAAVVVAVLVVRLGLGRALIVRVGDAVAILVGRGAAVARVRRKIVLERDGTFVLRVGNAVVILVVGGAAVVGLRGLTVLLRIGAAVVGEQDAVVIGVGRGAAVVRLGRQAVLGVVGASVVGVGRAVGVAVGAD
jgi:hypothetical protein